MKQKSIPKFDTSKYRNTSLFDFDLEDVSDEDDNIIGYETDE